MDLEGYGNMAHDLLYFIGQVDLLLSCAFTHKIVSVYIDSWSFTSHTTST